MPSLIEFLVKELVDRPEEVAINEVAQGESMTIEIRTAPGDIGKVIGKQGRIVNALRSIAKVGASKSHRRVFLEVVD